MTAEVQIKFNGKEIIVSKGDKFHITEQDGYEYDIDIVGIWTSARSTYKVGFRTSVYPSIAYTKNKKELEKFISKKVTDAMQKGLRLPWFIKSHTVPQYQEHHMQCKKAIRTIKHFNKLKLQSILQSMY